MRAAVLLLVIAGMGYRQVVWLLGILFHVEISKSSLQRWVGEIAGQLPGFEKMIKLLNEKRPITEGHLDEMFPRGTDDCVLVLKDGHGRILASQAVGKRDEETVKPFLQRIGDTGIRLKSFYTDGCRAYFNAIRAVFGDTVNIQYDYFHIIQNAWRHLRKWATEHRRDVKRRSENVSTPWYKKRLTELAKNLWDNRYLVFKSEKNMTEEEKELPAEVVGSDQKIGDLRAFLGGIWNIFEDSRDEREAMEALEKLKEMKTDRKNPVPFRKVTEFMEKHFRWMTAFLRCENVRRNSLAETSMRVLRRLEIAHDGFRSDKGREDFLRIYQAVRYLGWNIYDPPELMEIQDE